MTGRTRPKNFDAMTGAQPGTDVATAAGKTAVAKKPTKQKDNGRLVDTGTVRKVIPPEAGGRPRVVWDDSRMRTTYANICNVASTREEVTLLFGTNQTWNLKSSKELCIRLSDRFILSPFAAKRLARLINDVVGKYEKRFGVLDTGVPRAKKA